MIPRFQRMRKKTIQLEFSHRSKTTFMLWRQNVKLHRVQLAFESEKLTTGDRLGQGALKERKSGRSRRSGGWKTYSSCPAKKKRHVSDKDAKRKKQWQNMGKDKFTETVNKETRGRKKKQKMNKKLKKKEADKIKSQKDRYRPYQGLWGCFLPSLSSR